MILEAYTLNKKRTITRESSTTKRSLISKEYANRFIREFICEDNEIIACKDCIKQYFERKSEEC